MNKKSEEELINEALKVNLQYIKGQVYRGNKFHYDYLCDTHGIIRMTPQVIIAGHNCKKCSYKSKEKTIDQLNIEAGLVNMDFIDPYYGTHTKTAYNCPVHGHFNMSPHDIKDGQKCPDCAIRGFKQTKPASFYILYCKNDNPKLDFIGFGVTNNLKTRLKGHRSGLKGKGFIIESYSVLNFNEGRLALWLERLVRYSMNDCMINTGIVGFKKEAFSVKYFAKFKIVFLFAIQLLKSANVNVEQFTY